MKNFNCKIDSHIPTENGLHCECGYFRKDKINIYDLKEKFKEVDETIEIGKAILKKYNPELV